MESYTKGSGKSKQDYGDFALATLSEQDPPLASLTSVLVRRYHPGDLTPLSAGTWAVRLQRPSRLLGELLPTARDAVLPATLTAALITRKVTRWQDVLQR